jgi:hypothetical protein
MADSQQSALQDCYCSCEAFEIPEGSEIANGLAGRNGGLIGQAEHNDAGMAAGRVGADIPEPAIQGDQDPSGCGGCSDNILVGRPSQSLVGDSVDVVARAGKDCSGRGGKVLVQLELHRDCGSGSSSSRASAAP